MSRKLDDNYRAIIESGWRQYIDGRAPPVGDKGSACLTQLSDLTYLYRVTMETAYKRDDSAPVFMQISSPMLLGFCFRQVLSEMHKPVRTSLELRDVLTRGYVNPTAKTLLFRVCVELFYVIVLFKQPRCSLLLFQHVYFIAYIHSVHQAV